MSFVLTRNTLTLLTKFSNLLICGGLCYLVKEVLKYNYRFEAIFKEQKKYYKQHFSKKEINKIYKDSKKISKEHLNIILYDPFSKNHENIFKMSSNKGNTNEKV